jgi:hypothetical protein
MFVSQESTATAVFPGNFLDDVSFKHVLADRGWKRAWILVAKVAFT